MKNATFFLEGFTNRKIIFLLFVFLCVFFVPVASMSASCDEVHGQSNMNVCAINQSHKADDALDAIYKKLMSKISPSGQEKLRLAEEAWSDYRKKQCTFDTLGTTGGSVNAMVFANCYEYMARQQAKHLQEQLSCEEGDLSCGRQ